jgi:hypothetical protein
LTKNQLINSIYLVKPYCHNLLSIHNWVLGKVSFPNDLNLFFKQLERSNFIRAISKLSTRMFVSKTLNLALSSKFFHSPIPNGEVKDGHYNTCSRIFEPHELFINTFCKKKLCSSLHLIKSMEIIKTNQNILDGWCFALVVPLHSNWKTI